jgi:hypothetical protein
MKPEGLWQDYLRRIQEFYLGRTSKSHLAREPDTSVGLFYAFIRSYIIN